MQFIFIYSFASSYLKKHFIWLGSWASECKSACFGNPGPGRNFKNDLSMDSMFDSYKKLNSRIWAPTKKVRSNLHPSLEGLQITFAQHLPIPKVVVNVGNVPGIHYM